MTQACHRSLLAKHRVQARVGRHAIHLPGLESATSDQRGLELSETARLGWIAKGENDLTGLPRPDGKAMVRAALVLGRLRRQALALASAGKSVEVSARSAATSAWLPGLRSVRRCCFGTHHPVAPVGYYLSRIIGLGCDVGNQWRGRHV